MKNNVEKSIKRWLKRKVTITLGLIVAFMIIGGKGYSNDGLINQEVIIIKLENGNIVTEIGGQQTEIGNSWTNNGKIEVTEGNGIEIDSSVTDFNLTNNGIISGNNSSDKNNGNGILNYGTITTLTNSGLIKGNSNLKGYSGNGIYNYSQEGIIATIETLANSGIISGNNSSGLNSGNGIYNNKGTIEILANSGIISGNSSSDNYNVGNGNGIENTGTITTLTNSGIIKGNGSSNENDDGNGNGIENTETITTLANSGIITGNNNLGDSNGNGIYNNLGTIKNLKNYGIIAGSHNAIYDLGTITYQYNYGLQINGAGTNNVTINAGAGGEVNLGTDEAPDNRFIINTIEKNNSYVKLENEKAIDIKKINSELDGNDSYKISDNSFKNLILNGYGTTLEVSGSLTLDNSIINGGLDEKSATIKGSDIADNLTLTNGTIINGDTDLGAGDDKLSIDNTIQINGDLNGGDGEKDTLTFNTSNTKSNEDNINIFNNINSFENINIGTNVTFFEGSKVTGAEKININKDGNLILRIDGTEKNGNNQIIGNALSKNKGTIHSDGGKLLLALNGVGEGETISFGDNILDETMKGNEIGYSEDITLDTTSLLHKIKKENKNTVIVNTVEDLPTTYLPNNVDYNKLDRIYQSIRSTNQVGEFKVTDDKTLTGFVKYLHDIYAGSPYAFSSELSRKSMDMFKSSILSKDLKPELNKWAIYGGLTHIDGGTKDEYYGKGYYTYDVGSRDISADTKITGAYMQAEYGKSESLTTGIVFGGNNSETEIGASKVDGDSFYFGAYAKKYLNDFRFTLGAGFQHGDYKADRTAVGYEGITDTRDFSENYHDRGFNIYGDVKYSKEITENLFIEPYFTLGYSYVDQDGVSEDGVLSIETDSGYFDYATGKVGVDIKKVVPIEKGKHTLTAGVSYENILDGDDEEYITGRFKGGSDFDILVPEKNNDIFSLNVKYEFEFENGIMFDVNGSYTFENDNMEDEWIAGVGVGYRF